MICGCTNFKLLYHNLIRIANTFLSAMKLLAESDLYFNIMPEYYKVSEYAPLKDINERTVYRWIKNDDINAREIDGEA